MVDLAEFAASFNEIIGGYVATRRETVKGSPAILGAVVFSAVFVTQILTDANPIGRCIQFWRQLSNQVSIFL
jgi:hypothetical protein